MNISQLIDEDHVLCCPEVSSKKRLLEVVSELLAVNLNHISTHEIFDSLINREKLGSTGLGKGVAIPHGRIHAPVKLVWGARDPFFPLDKATAMLEQFGGPTELAVIEDGKLFAHEDRPEAFVAQTIPFLRRHLGGAASVAAAS